jgi:hypothetical protein
VRSAGRLPAEVAENPRLTAIEADLLSIPTEELEGYVRGCDAVVSCLGHNLSFKGMYGQPRYLVRDAVERVSAAIHSVAPEHPVRLVLMSSVSVNEPRGTESRRGTLDRAVVAFTRFALPPAKDNQRASDFLNESLGRSDSAIEWVVVRPDSLRDGDVTEYEIHDGLVASLFKPDETNMANVAHFMCELVTDDETWARWRGAMPVITNAGPTAG